MRLLTAELEMENVDLSLDPDMGRICLFENIFIFLLAGWLTGARREVNCLFIFTDQKMIRTNEREERERRPSTISPDQKTTSNRKWMRDENFLQFEVVFQIFSSKKLSFISIFYRDPTLSETDQ